MKTWQHYWQAWLNRRIPAQPEHTLHHASIFIMPNKTGLIFSALLVAMLLTAINYQNSLIFALVFWLFSMALLAIFFTFKNLSGVRLRAGNGAAVFAGKPVDLLLRISAKEPKWALSVFFKDQLATPFSLSAGEEKMIYLPYFAEKRGRLDVARIGIETRFPLGVFTAWSWVKLEFPIVVYPKPIEQPFVLSTGRGEDEGHSQKTASGENFYGLRAYQAGDALKHIAWKHYARGQGLFSKEFAGAQSFNWQFNFDDLTGEPLERRLSILCAWLLKAHAQDAAFGLTLPGKHLPLGQGDAHLERCLEALALYGETP